MKFNGIDFDTYLKNYPDDKGYFGKYGGSYVSADLQKAMDVLTCCVRLAAVDKLLA